MKCFTSFSGTLAAAGCLMLKGKPSGQHMLSWTWELDLIRTLSTAVP